MKKRVFLYIVCMWMCMFGVSMQVYASQTEKELQAANTEKRVIRVGWYERDGYFEKDKDGKLVGFGMDYLNAVANYTGWEYEFVQGTREQCIFRLQNDKIDIMAPIRSDDPLMNIHMPKEVIGEDFGYIYKLGNNFKICYEEFDKFERLIIGVESGSGMYAKVMEYCKKNDFKFYDIIFFNTLDEMRKELASKKIDALATDSYINIENLKVIGRFSNGRVTFAVSDEELLDELNDAMENIKLDDPDFTAELRKRYFSEGSQNEMEYSVKEREFLSVGRRYKVALLKEQYPISYLASDEKGRKGIAVDILKKLEYYSGIRFEIVYVDDYAQGRQLQENGEVDILGGSIISKQSVGNLIRTGEQSEPGVKKEYISEFYDMDMAFIGPKGTNMEESLRVAVPVYMNKGLSELESMYPSYHFTIFGSDEECLNAILNNTMDAAVQSDLKINELMMYDKYKNMQNLKFIPGTYTVAFSLYTEDSVLAEIMNKTLRGLSNLSLATIENNNIQHIALQRISLADFVKQYKWEIILIIIAIGAVNFSWSGYRKFKQEQESKEKAYKDSIANISSMEKFRIDVEPILNGMDKQEYCVIAADVDKFKIINDLFGYEEGDRAIAFIARLFENELEKSDFITRSNADHYIILKHAQNDEEVEVYLKKVYARLEEIFVQKDVDYRLILKAGIYRIQEEDRVLSSVIDKANMAKMNMEIGHKSSYNFYSEKIRQKGIEDKRLENDMGKALQSKQFKVFMQPQVDLKTKKIVGAEALVRWIHPKEGVVPPDKFIPVFEKNGFVRKLDLFVWEETIKTIRKWLDNEQITVPISINLSRIDIQKEGMIQKLTDMLDKYAVDTKWVKTELTESVCLENDKIILDRMKQLKERGFKIAVDDFGSGYSSLHLLKRMPIDILKIDKSFLDFNTGMQKKDEILIRDVVELGKHLNLQIIVEGVENLEQSEFLESIGCDIAQGYYYGRPMTIKEFERALQKSYEEEE